MNGEVQMRLRAKPLHERHKFCNVIVYTDMLLTSVVICRSIPVTCSLHTYEYRLLVLWQQTCGCICTVAESGVLTTMEIIVVIVEHYIHIHCKCVCVWKLVLTGQSAESQTSTVPWCLIVLAKKSRLGLLTKILKCPPNHYFQPLLLLLS